MQCDVCELWVHQICGLFNKGRNKEDTPYVCPSCLLEGEPEAFTNCSLKAPEDCTKGHAGPMCITVASSNVAYRCLSIPSRRRAMHL